MPETDQESRLRRYLAAYERLCKKYGLMVEDQNVKVCEHLGGSTGHDYLTSHMKQLKQGGINA